jgi:hypothetical protein
MFQIPNVLFVMHGVNDAAGAEEEQRFEERVRAEVIHGGVCSRAVRVAQADGHHHVTELRKRRVSEDAFDVVLLDGHQRGEERGDAADPRDDLQRRNSVQKAEPLRPGLVRAVDEKHAAEHVDTGGHHRRGVNERADGRWAFHRVWQPDMERELCALAHGSHEN